MLGINNSMAKKYLTLVEAYLSRFQRGGFLVGDVFKFNDNFKTLDCYKNLGQNVGGHTYSSDVSPYYNSRERTFREFLEIIQGLV